MNLILHNIKEAHIEYGDVLADPLNYRNGIPILCHRVIANPPFSQNYRRASMKHPERFNWFAPETGKKADLMFVQHMLASLHPTGKMAVVMPHGVLFRSGKEKEIRQGLLTRDGSVIEAIISLPPKLFYGTGIPAAILVLNKNKPDKLYNKVLFINADAEYAEGKNQNSLRPEDIEKIDYVYTHLLEVPGYSRLVDMADIKAHDWNLNIRRYVDNTPPPEPEDVRAHLVGGVPKAEVQAQTRQLVKFHLNGGLVFQERDAVYYDFKPEIQDKESLKTVVEQAPGVKQTQNKLRSHLSDWWAAAQHDFARLVPRPDSPPDARQHKSERLLLSTMKESRGAYLTLKGQDLPDVRRALIQSLKEQLTPLGVLDDFQVAGVFVNWWDSIKYDLKTMMTNGWSPTLIPDSYILAAYFQMEAREIEELEAAVSEIETALEETVTAAQELLEYELGEEEKLTAALMKQQLNENLKMYEDGEEYQAYQTALKAITEAEKKRSNLKRQLREKQFELEIKILLKKFGPEDETIESRRLLTQAEGELDDLKTVVTPDTIQKKKMNALQRDIKTLQERIAAIKRLTDKVGGVITEVEAKTLILQKHHDLVTEQLDRYLN